MMRGILRNIFIVFISILFTLICAELILGFYGFTPLIIAGSTSRIPVQVFRANSWDDLYKAGVITGELGKLKPDKDLGYTHYKKPYGFLDGKNFLKNVYADKKILVLGDSYAGGTGARKGKGFVWLLDKHYRQRKIEFFNTGIGGYGQGNELAVLTKYFDVLKPHIVLLCFYPGNDFFDNLTPLDRKVGLPGAWMNNYEVILTKTSAQIRKRSLDEKWKMYQHVISWPGPIQYSSLREYFLYNFFYKTRIGSILWQSWKTIRQTKYPLEKRIRAQEGKDFRSDYDYIVTKEYFLRIKEFLQQKNTPLYVFIIPDKKISYGKLKKSHDYNRGLSLLQELSIPHIEMFDQLSLEDYEGRVDIPPISTHWNESGHYKAYLRLKDFFDDLWGLPGGREDMCNEGGTVLIL